MCSMISKQSTPKEIGERSEGQIIAAFLRAGEVVLTPFGDSQRYDIVLDQSGTFVRVQCKTGRISGGSIVFDTCSNNWRTKARRNYRGDIDLFAVYVPATGKIYLVPVTDVGVRTATLRLKPTRNGQKNRIRLAEIYEYTLPEFPQG